MLRVGLGKDIHRLVSGRPFLLGGVEIPHTQGESGHSDGDVLIHAIIDALLGAAGLADIGELFPGSPEWKDADSKKLLSIAWDMVKKEGWRIVNIDCVVCCEAPKILLHRDAIRKSLASILQIASSHVFVKGKTAEGLGDLGRGEAVEALALCLLEKTERSVNE
jgi:2-C-methyl-D-erythritol 2,4-cyclodiphosphate synthase